MNKSLRKAVIAGNWKMNKTPAETKEIITAMKPLVADATCDVVLCVPYIDIFAAQEAAKGSNIKIGAENCHWAESGAFTAEVSAPMLKSIGVEYVIIGHSERREIFKEDNELIKAKVKSAYEYGLCPILCVGERLEQREAGETVEVCAGQLLSALEDLTAEEVEQMIVAYEPIWAIGTGKVATAQDAEETIKALRQAIADKYGAATAEKVRIQYGGSVKPENVKELMAQPNIDGALVGGASLKPESFAKLVRYQEA